MYHTHFNAESCHNFAIYTFRLVKSYKSFRIRLPLEILRNFSKPFSEAATGGVPQNVFFKHFKIFSGKQLCWGLFFNKVAGHQSCNFIKTWIKKRPQNSYFLWYREIYNNTYLIWRKFGNSCIGKSFVRTFFRSEFSKGNFWWKKCSPVVWKVAQISQDWTKMFPIIKY